MEIETNGFLVDFLDQIVLLMNESYGEREWGLRGLLQADGNYEREGVYQDFVALRMLFECVGMDNSLSLFENFQIFVLYEFKENFNGLRYSYY